MICTRLFVAWWHWKQCSAMLLILFRSVQKTGTKRRRFCPGFNSSPFLKFRPERHGSVPSVPFRVPSTHGSLKNPTKTPLKQPPCSPSSYSRPWHRVETQQEPTIWKPSRHTPTYRWQWLLDLSTPILSHWYPTIPLCFSKRHDYTFVGVVLRIWEWCEEVDGWLWAKCGNAVDLRGLAAEKLGDLRSGRIMV